MSPTYSRLQHLGIWIKFVCRLTKCPQGLECAAGVIFICWPVLWAKHIEQSLQNCCASLEKCEIKQSHCIEAITPLYLCVPRKVTHKQRSLIVRHYQVGGHHMECHKASACNRQPLRSQVLLSSKCIDLQQ